MQRIQISNIKPNDHNPRDITEEKFSKLVKSIQDFPKMLEVRPLVIDENNIVLGGNMRLKALQKAGVTEVPVEQVTDWTEEQKKEFIIKDNIGYGEWDWEMLGNEWDKDELEEWGLELHIEEDEELEAEEDDYEMPPEDQIETDIVIGDVFEIGHHRLMCGDSTSVDDVEKLMSGEKADMVFTDPPYGMFLDTDYSSMSNSEGKSNKYDKVIGDNEDFKDEIISTIFTSFNYCEEIFIWGGDYFAELIPNRNNGSWIVWDKRESEETGKNVDRRIGSMFELCWSKNKHKRLIARIMWAGMMGVKDDSKRVHPTQKPTHLSKWFFNEWGNNGDLVADLYLGSGSTMVACHQLNRKCYGMELDPKYCQVIIDRMKKLDPELVIKKNGEIVN